MIDEEEAVRIAGRIQQVPRDDPDRPWYLVEFPEGWLIAEPNKPRGGVTRTIERSAGRVLRFPSGVPPRRIVEEFDKVLGRGLEEDF